MIGVLSVCVFMLCLLLFLPLQEIFPRRNLQNSLNIILSRSNRSKNQSYSSSLLIPKLYSLLAFVARVFRIDGFAPRWFKYKSQLSLASVERYFTVEQFVAVKYLSSVAVFLYFVGLFLVSMSLEMLVLGTLMSVIVFFLPDQWLKTRIKQRRLKIQKEIPSILISLAVTTDAGLTLLQALEEVCTRKSGELSLEIKKTLQEIAIGIPQKEAFEKMANRLLVDELTLMVSALLQTMQKGSAGITKVLREQANEAWMKRKSLAKEMGEKASIKLFFPLMGFILPALMIFLIAPAIFTIMRFFEF